MAATVNQLISADVCIYVMNVINSLQHRNHCKNIVQNIQVNVHLSVTYAIKRKNVFCILLSRVVCFFLDGLEETKERRVQIWCQFAKTKFFSILQKLVFRLHVLWVSTINLSQDFDIKSNFLGNILIMTNIQFLYKVHWNWISSSRYSSCRKNAPL